MGKLKAITHDTFWYCGECFVDFEIKLNGGIYRTGMVKIATDPSFALINDLYYMPRVLRHIEFKPPLNVRETQGMQDLNWQQP